MKYKILIVDDMEFNRELTARLLEIHGFDVLTAIDGQQAIKISQEKHPNLILMDIGLPDIDGWEVTSIIKSNKSTKDIPIIALTAHESIEYRDKAESTGCTGFLTKPLDTQLLIEEINKSLDPEQKNSYGNI